MHFIGFLLSSFVFAALLGMILGNVGIAVGSILGGLLFICGQLGDLTELLKKSNNIERK